ncbi:GNAT family N-acetyltransferase [Halalkalibacterium halodurans]|uniref:BH0466 protein n=1 Tax=Halalkalibacterium halodurans (strain ATCC BAA-125 / DSM 18197 / FERM 7344 / JCM 9153 / C-125) TaxID=272558 RepID=Q9KFL3_HALH5|nr:GNAT family N-acetyltransferase [Halalkalibacterium halodurans]MDY7220963.1 GNAT family N-acetyltransferase [Halalkalibacterium halodurans]MDY7240202.1 GNAT family N-acetyltransferase [Halalkalibacterium halodurans]MED4083222.1 GNAT family N-acetyltransferase [Halalkalibacterium halodurans]MED4086596.1 GNAT family N-acetyltransferase [Halalkalibacterium halodurans]MED4105602.1 GNAT family N-acetyltransferase [Halalkalibacterium halodurans]
MITIEPAKKQHVEGIVRVCSEGYRQTYRETYSTEYMERVIREFYDYERIEKELKVSQEWGGWFVAIDDGQVIGAGAGGLTADHVGEIFVLYMDPVRRGEGVGTELLEAITAQQKEFGAMEQWVSVAKGNEKGIPFYEAKGFICIDEKKSYATTEEEAYTSLRYKRSI